MPHRHADPKDALPRLWEFQGELLPGIMECSDIRGLRSSIHLKCRELWRMRVITLAPSGNCTVRRNATRMATTRRCSMNRAARNRLIFAVTTEAGFTRKLLILINPDETGIGA